MKSDDSLTKLANEIKKRNQASLGIQPGDNRLYLSHDLQLATLPKINKNDGGEVSNRIAEYFAICSQNDVKPNMPGMCLALGIHRNTLKSWLNGSVKKDPEVIAACEKGMAILNAQMEDWMQSGKISPVSGIWIMKNNFGYKDQTEIIYNNAKEETYTEEKLIEDSIFVECEDVDEDS